jgi:L-fuculose-phosphate aldolase
MNQLLSELIEAGKEIVSQGLVRGSGGNVSGLATNQLWITRSGANLGTLTETDFVLVENHSASTGQQPRPSSELAMHLAVYKAQPETTIVLHVHPPKAISLGLLGLPLPALTPDFYLHLGPAGPLLPYITPTTDELAAAVHEQLATNPAVLLQNHGVLVTGHSTRQALLRLFLLEEHAAIYLDALAAGRPIRLLNEQDMEALDQVTGGRYKKRT